VLRTGVAGAAAATVIAQLSSCLFCLARLRRLPIVHPGREDFRLCAASAGRQLKLGFPIAAQNVIIAVGGMFVQSIVNGMGVAFIAGYTATNKLYGVLEIAAVSYGYAVSTYAGQNLGAGKYDRIRKGIHGAVGLGIVTALCIGGLMILFGPHIVGSFLSGAKEQVSEALRIAVEYLNIMAAFLPILYLLYIYRSALQGMGNTLMPMISGFVELVMRIGCALILPRFLGVWGIYVAEVSAWFGAEVMLMAVYFVRMARLRRQTP
jgi:Na+-driven multidrug efflux pump